MGKRNSKGNINTYLNWPIIMALYLLVLVIVLYFISSAAGLVASFFVLIYTIYALYLRFTKFNYLQPAIMALAEQVSKKQQIYLSKLDLPHAILTDEGMIAWANDRCFDIAKSIAVGKNIKDTFPEINTTILKGIHEEKIDLLTSYGTNKYRLHLRPMNLNDGSDDLKSKVFPKNARIIMMYLYDETDYYNLKQDYDNNKQVTGFIYIDNYYEIAENLEDSKAAMLIAMVDRKLTRYISFNSGILKKLEKDKYFFVTTKKDIEDMMEDRFSILDQAKEILGGDNLPLTLSIGVGYEGKSIESNHDLARVAIDMALGRGGDQAVIKKGAETLFFGGKSSSNASNVRVRARVKATSFKEILDTKDKVLIMGHKNGDFDSFGASVGTYIMARHLGKDVHIVINSSTNAVTEMLNKYKKNDNYEKDMFISGDEALNFADEDTLLVVVDHNTSKISDEVRLYDKGLDTVVFDHHRVGEFSISNAILSYIDSGASSTCELISEVMSYFEDRLKLRSLEGDTLLAGIMIDTRYFTYQTSAKTFEAAAYLRKKGADSDRVRKMLRVDAAFEELKNKVVASAEYYKDAYAIALVSTDNKNIEESVAKAEIANELVNIKGVKASFVMSKENDAYQVSSRSIDEINVQLIMEKFGGGGHSGSAGGTINASSYEEAKEMLKKAIDEVEEESE